MVKPNITDVTEQKRLNDAREAGIPWKKWGPYLSERQWGTVREDYSEDGNAWDYFTHDQARSRAYRWGEDGLGGICDDKQRLCFALALWNERDPILKERLFGLTNSEANHGEDVKEYYFYIDSTPTHSYMKYLYKYPQREYPYRDLIETNRRRSREEFEYELLDTGVFDEDRYFDVFVEYAKEGPEDVLVQGHRPQPRAGGGPAARAADAVVPEHVVVGRRRSEAVAAPSRAGRRARVTRRARRVLAVVRRRAGAALHREREQRQPSLGPAQCLALRQGCVPRLRRLGPGRCGEPREGGDQGRGALRARRARRGQPDGPPAARSGAGPATPSRASSRRSRAGSRTPTSSTQRITPQSLSEDERRVHRQALAGMLWSKQFYYFDLERWLSEHKSHPLLESARPGVRNTEWFHMLNADIISMPDKWEYPWYAAWDLAFHTTALALVDFDFAKEQLLLMLRSLYAHPNGQIPAYEWNFSDVNPPVHAWATLYLYKMERTLGRADLRFLERSFQGLMLNFNWWVNRKDPSGKNVFAGGFLGLDNIGVFDRSAQLPTGGSLEQADGTAWMAFYCQCMLEMALILTEYDSMYEEVAFKFIQHFMWISYAMDRLGEHHDEMWDEEDGFFYDLLRLPDGQAMRLKVRSLVGLLPLCASTVFEGDVLSRMPKLVEMIALFRKRHPELVSHVAPTDEGFIGHKGRRLLSILNRTKLERVLGYLLDENEFLGPHGIRSLSRHHRDHPFRFWVGSQEYSVHYLPAESDTGDVRRQLQLARPGLDAGQRADRPGAAESLQLLRRRVQGAVSHRLRPAHDAVRGRAGDRVDGCRPRSCGTATDDGRSMAGWQGSRKTRTGAI